MILEIDIWRSAQVIVKRYGDAAPREALNRAERFEKAGDARGAAVWRRILHAVEQIQSTTPPEGTSCH